MNTKKMEGFCWMIMSFVFVLIAILHPRIIFFMLIIVCMIGSIVCFKVKSSKPPKTIGGLCIKMLGNILAIIFVCYLGQFFDVFFPDSIPDSTSGVEWVCSPGMMQGTSYPMLFFHADKLYLQEIVDTYKINVTVYVWDDQYEWTNYDMERGIKFPGESKIEKTDRNHVQVFILYDNSDVNHIHNAGFYVNQLKGYICFFCTVKIKGCVPLIEL